jgi:perosamine synthetase
MERLDEFVARKRAIARRYDEALAGIEGIAPFPEASWAKSACWFSGLLAPSAGRHSGQSIVEALTASGIGARPFWKPMHLQAPYAECLRGRLDFTDGLWRRIVALPCSTGLSEAQQEQVIAVLNRALGRSAA